MVKLRENKLKKIAYHSTDEEQRPITSHPENTADELSSTETGGRSMSAVEMTTAYNGTDPGQYDNVKIKTKESNPLGKDLLDVFTILGDELDNSNEEVLADLADLLLVKFAAASTFDFTKAFNQLMIKINNADLVDTNEFLKKLAKIYSRTLVLEYMNNEDMDKAKESAYKKTLHRANQYLSE